MDIMEERKKALFKGIMDRGDSFEHILDLYANCVCDMVDDDEEIRKLAKPHLTDFEINGDKYGVPSAVGIVEKLIKELEKQNEEIERLKEYEWMYKDLCKWTTI